MWVPQKARRDTLHQTCIFASRTICMSCSIFGASVVRNAEAQIFMLWWARCGSHKKRAGTHYVELVFGIMYDPEVTLRILVRPGCETSTHYFLFPGGPRAGLTRSAPGHVTPNLCFCIPCDLEVT
jgi:hypothetical protein